MSERELTRDVIERIIFECHEDGLSYKQREYLRSLGFTDAALRAERDEYKRKYELVLNNAAYGECCEIRAKAEAERDALKVPLSTMTQAVGLATTCAPDMEIDSTNPIGMMQVVCERFADLTRKLAEADALNTRLMAVKEQLCRILSGT